MKITHLPEIKKLQMEIAVAFGNMYLNKGTWWQWIVAQQKLQHRIEMIERERRESEGIE